MTDPVLARSFLLGEVAALEPYGFVAEVPVGRPLSVIEVTQNDDDDLEVRVPGRPPGVTELTVEVRGALEKRGFAAEDPTDSRKPWIRNVTDGDEAVGLV